MLIDVLLVVGDEGLGDSLTDGVDLGSVTTTGDADTDVNTGKLVGTDDEERLVDLDFMYQEGVVPFGLFIVLDLAYLEAEDLGLDQREGLAVNLDETLALL